MSGGKFLGTAPTEFTPRRPAIRLRRPLNGGLGPPIPPWLNPSCDSTRILGLLAATVLASLSLALFSLFHVSLFGPATAYLCSPRWHGLLQQQLTNSSMARGTGGGGEALGSANEDAENFIAIGAERICSGVRIHEALVEAHSQQQGVGRLATQAAIYRELDIFEANCSAMDVGTSTPYMPLPTYSRRRYLWLASVPEQLSKARQHLAEAVSLAKLSRRTLVLPRVGDSHVGAARLLPFCVYFDADRLAVYVPWVTEDFFLKLVRHSRWQIKSRYLCVLSPGKEVCSQALGRYLNPALLLSSLALTQTSFMDPRSSLVVHSGYHPARDTNVTARQAEEEHLKDALWALRSFNLVAFVQNDYFFTINDTVRADGLEAVQYAPYLRDKARAFAARLQPSFVTIHLRLEWQLFQVLKTSPVGPEMDRRLVECSEKAVEMAQYAATQTGARHVFLASDVRFHGNFLQWQSDSLPYNETEIFLMSQSLAKSLSFIYDKLAPTTWDDEDKRYKKRDGGVRATLDKLVCGEAVVFLEAHKVCGGGQSFDVEIEQMRLAAGMPANSTWIFGGPSRKQL